MERGPDRPVARTRRRAVRMPHNPTGKTKVTHRSKTLGAGRMERRAVTGKNARLRPFHVAWWPSLAWWFCVDLWTCVCMCVCL